VDATGQISLVFVLRDHILLPPTEN
jgi:hypothetical protein